MPKKRKLAMSKRQTFRQVEITRAIKGATAAGLAVNRVEVMPDGRLILSEVADTAPDTQSEADNWFNRKG
jgi:hypothetical protein